MNDTRDLTKRLAQLLSREHGALAAFLVALADFDRERRWVELGHTSLFYFLHRELGLSKGAAFYRITAAELIQRYPEVVEPLREGKLCIMSVVELAKVITPDNRGEVLPRFFHASKREAKATAAELRPAEAAPHRDVVTVLQLAAPAKSVTRLEVATRHATPVALVQPDEPRGEVSARPPCPPQAAPLSAARPDEVEPLTGDLRRFHTTVSKRFLAKLAAARDGLSGSSNPGAARCRSASSRVSSTVKATPRKASCSACTQASTSASDSVRSATPCGSGGRAVAAQQRGDGAEVAERAPRDERWLAHEPHVLLRPPTVWR
jgi:hypothetical protein